MSTDLLDVEADVTVVEDVPSEEKQAKNREAMIAKVDKILGEKPKKKAETKQPDVEETPVEGAMDEPVELPQAVKDRAKDAGLSESLAERLHQSGLLEEALATFDRSLIEHTPKREPEKKPEAPQKEEKAKDDAPPPLSAEDYDEALVKRDAFLQGRIVELEAKLDRLSSLGEGFDRQRDGQFQDWFAKSAAGLNKDLFGDGMPSLQSAEYKNRQQLVDGYERICEARGVDPYGCHADLLQRAYPAMFHNEVFKAAQRQTVDRLRSAEGKFVNPPQKSGKPPVKKAKTPEETQTELVGKIDKVLGR
jgi:hypothetical protein